LGHRLSKHEMTRYAKNLSEWPPGPPFYAYDDDCAEAW